MSILFIGGDCSRADGKTVLSMMCQSWRQNIIFPLTSESSSHTDRCCNGGGDALAWRLEEYEGWCIPSRYDDNGSSSPYCRTSGMDWIEGLCRAHLSSYRCGFRRRTLVGRIFTGRYSSQSAPHLCRGEPGSQIQQAAPVTAEGGRIQPVSGSDLGLRVQHTASGRLCGISSAPAVGCAASLAQVRSPYRNQCLPSKALLFKVPPA